MSIVDNLPLAVEIAQDGKLIYANPFFLKMFGCDSLDQITGRPVADFYLPKFRTLLD
jgi:PAS domain-containing protein